MKNHFLFSVFIIIISYGSCSNNADDDVRQKIRNIAYRGIQNLKDGNFMEAEKQYDSVYKLDSNYEMVFFYKSEIYKYKGVFDSSIYFINRAIQINNRRPAYFESRAMLNFDNGNQDSALIDIQAAYQLDSNSVRICKSYASFLSHKDDFLGALIYSFKALNLDNSNHSIYLDIATLYFNLKQYDSSVYYSTKGLKLNINSSELYRIRGEAYLDNREIESACTDFRKVLELSKEEDIAVKKALLKYCK